MSTDHKCIQLHYFFLQTEPSSVTINQINKETQTHHSITAPSPHDLYLDLFVHIILMEAHGVFSFVWGPEIYHVVFCVVVNLLAEGVLLYDNVAICLSICWWTFGLFSKLGHCWWKVRLAMCISTLTCEGMAGSERLARSAKLFESGCANLRSFWLCITIVYLSFFHFNPSGGCVVVLMYISSMV